MTLTSSLFVNRMKSALIGLSRRSVPEDSQSIRALQDASGNSARDLFVVMDPPKLFSLADCSLTTKTSS